MTREPEQHAEQAPASPPLRVGGREHDSRGEAPLTAAFVQRGRDLARTRDEIATGAAIAEPSPAEPDVPPSVEMAEAPPPAAVGEPPPPAAVEEPPPAAVKEPLPSAAAGESPPVDREEKPPVDGDRLPFAVAVRKAAPLLADTFRTPRPAETVEAPSISIGAFDALQPEVVEDVPISVDGFEAPLPAGIDDRRPSVGGERDARPGPVERLGFGDDVEHDGLRQPEARPGAASIRAEPDAAAGPQAVVARAAEARLIPAFVKATVQAAVVFALVFVVGFAATLFALGVAPDLPAAVLQSFTLR